MDHTEKPAGKLVVAGGDGTVDFEMAERAIDTVALPANLATPPSRCNSQGMVLKSSFSAVAARDARVLILGSLPGERSLVEGRYYAHPQNQFWKLLSPIVGRDLTALNYEARLETIQLKHIALWDVIASAQRIGSADVTICDVTANDLAAFVDSLTELRAVAFNGGKALTIGRPLLANRDLAILALPSSSPLHTIGLAAKQPAWDAIAAYL